MPGQDADDVVRNAGKRQGRSPEVAEILNPQVLASRSPDFRGVLRSHFPEGRFLDPPCVMIYAHVETASVHD